MKEKAFDPSRFGVTVSDKKKREHAHSKSCYVLQARHGGSTGVQFRLVMTQDLEEQIIAAFGQFVGIGIDEKNRLYIWADESGRKISNKTVTIGSIKKQLIDEYGDFKRLYFEPKWIDEGRAVRFTPNGDIDAIAKDQQTFDFVRGA